MLNLLAGEQYPQPLSGNDEAPIKIHQYSLASGSNSESIWPIVALTDDDLGTFMAKHGKLSAYGQDLFLDIHNSFSDHNDLLVLSDAHARLLTLHSCPEALRAATESVGLRCGVLLNESSCGTNAITLALRYREPVMSNNPHSYGPLFNYWGAVAVPVLDAEHQTMACIAILNCADGSLGEKLLLAKFIARELQKFYKRPAARDTGVSLPVPETANSSVRPIPPSTYKVRQLCDRRRSLRTASPAMLAVGLTARQQQVLILFAQGMSYKEIAREIGITSYKTVEEHLDAVREKLQVSHRRGCIQKAMSLGLLN